MNHDLSYSIRHNQNPEVGTPEIRRKIANELKSAREFHERTLDQIRAFTKINTQYLESLEEGNWSFLPAVYVKLFIKAYAEAVGVQSDEFTNRLNEVFASVRIQTQTQENNDLFGDSLQLTGSARVSGFLNWAEKNRTMLTYGILTVLAIAVITYYLSRPPETATPVLYDQTGDITGKSTMDDSAGIEEVVPQQTVEETIVQPISKTFSFVIASTGTSYVKIEHLDSLLYEKTLWPGNRLDFNFPEPVKLTLGNAPIIHLVVEGDTLPEFTPNRRVRVVTLSSRGIE